HLIEDHAEREGLPLRFAACKVIEGDEKIIQQLKLDQNEKELLEHMVLQMETERGLDRSAAIADMRYHFIHRVCEACVIKPHESKERARSQRLDNLLTGKWTAIPVFIAIMALVFYLTFGLIGPFLQYLMEKGVTALASVTERAMIKGNVNPAIQSLVINGVFEGVGSVLSFLPLIVTMFFFLSMLEDSGYIARVAFFMDKLLRKIGLSGRSIVPMLIGFGCTVPAVMSTRTLPSDRDRRMTILLTPFMSCTAKLPIYAFFVNAFFKGQSWWIISGLYVLGVLIGILVAFLFKKTLFRGEPVPFVMELPNYRLPGARNVFQLLWDKARDFLQRAFTVILIATLVIWLLKSYDFRFNFVGEDTSKSMMAAIAGVIAPVLKPIGLGSWRIVTSLISGFMAKESVVSVMEMLFEGGVTGAVSALSAASMLVFSLLYTPCVAAIASIKRELGGKWALYLVLWQCAIAWVAALLVRLIGSI
ncbi:MAG: ferrous iron transport protein B, partial [Clostridia bacterium]|nr:ferrous iron transport protein B [Clostridia bacterium]